MMLLYHTDAQTIEWHGHRGARGLMPENSIPGFIKALQCGVHVLEMDVVISKDNKVLLSHEPWLSHEICYNAQGRSFTKQEERNYSLYEMMYDSIRLCDCGSKIHPRFPQQEKIKVYKPLLQEVIDTVETYCRMHQLPLPKYNIEIKSSPEGDAHFHPSPQEFAALLNEVIIKNKLTDRVYVQSFDVRSLRAMRYINPSLSLVLLMENAKGVKRNLRQLGFEPAVYSPYFKWVNKSMIGYFHRRNIKVIPWTVNKQSDMKRLIEMGVDGIITDYPDLISSFKQP